MFFLETSDRFTIGFDSNFFARDPTHDPLILPISSLLFRHFSMDFSSLSSAEQVHMNKVIEKKQVSLTCPCCVTKKLTITDTGKMQDFLRMYANIVERCFNTCCNDFTSKALSSKEVPFVFYDRVQLFLAKYCRINA